MTKRDDTSMAEQNAEIRRWAEENGLTVGARLGQQPDAVERVAPRVPVVEVTVRIDEDVYEAAMLRATYDGYDNASEVVEAALREVGAGVLGPPRCIWLVATASQGNSPVMRMRCDTPWVFSAVILAVAMIRRRRVVRSLSLGA